VGGGFVGVGRDVLVASGRVVGGSVGSGSVLARALQANVNTKQAAPANIVRGDKTWIFIASPPLRLSH